MLELKLHRYLNKMKTPELKDFKKYLNFIYRSDNEVNVLYNYIYECRNGKKTEEITIPLIQLHLFPHLNRKSIQNICSVIVKNIENYWTYSDLKTQTLRWNVSKFESLNKRGLHNEANKLALKLERKINKDTDLNLWTNYHIIKMLHEQYFSNNPIKRNQEDSLRILKSLVQTKERLNSDFSLYYSAELASMERLYGQDWNNELDTLQSSSKPDQRNLSQGLYKQFNLINNDYQEFPVLLNQLIRLNEDEISSSLRITFFYRVRRHLILQSRKGNEKAKGQLRDLIIWSSKSSLFMHNNQIADMRFVSDINILCQLKEVDEANDYIESLIKHVPSKEKNELRNLGKMYIEFALNNFGKVIEIFSTTKFKVVSQRLQASGLFLQAHYEEDNDDIEFLESKIRSIKDYLHRHKTELGIVQSNSWKGFLKVYELLVAKTEMNLVQEFIDRQEHIIYKIWLQKQIKRGA